jgi:hypothetical protein
LNRGSKRIRRRCKVWSSVKNWRQYERVESYDAEVQGTGSVGRVQWDTWAAAGPLVREVVIAPKGPLSALKAHHGMRHPASPNISIEAPTA